MQQMMQMEIVTQVGPYDVLFGRGSGPNDHEGNIRFRKHVAERKSEYMATNHRLTKAKIAREIVDAVFRENGRFLKKIEGDEARMLGIPDGLEAWTGVDEDTIMEKAKQALRQNTAKNKNDPSCQSPIPGPGMRNTIPSMFSNQLPQVSLQGTVGIHYHHQPEQDLGYGGVADDLEPIPIPSRNYDEDDDDVGAESLLPTPFREAGQGGVNAWEATVINPMEPATASRADKIGEMGPRGAAGFVNSMNPPGFVESRFPTGAGFNPPSAENSMLPPAARVPSMVRSSGVLPKGMDKSMDMGELMESFSSKTRIGIRGGTKDLGESAETMGTIDRYSAESTTDMSLATFNSAVFSVQNDGGGPFIGGGETRGGRRTSFRPTNERSFNELEAEEPPRYVRTSLVADSAAGSDFLSSTRFGLASDASMSIADLGASAGQVARQTPNAGNRRASATSLLKGVQENGYREAYDSLLGEVGGAPEDYHGNDSTDGIEGMGSSSLYLLKGMLMSQDEIAIGGRQNQDGAGTGGNGPK